MDEPALAGLLRDDLVDPENGVHEPGHLLGLGLGQVLVVLLQLGSALDKGPGELLPSLDLVSRGESQVLGLHLAGLEPVQQGSGGVVPADDLQGDQVVGGGAVNLAVVADDLHPLDPHPVLGGLANVVVVDSCLVELSEPVLGRPAQGLPLVGDLGGYDLVEN